MQISDFSLKDNIKIKHLSVEYFRFEHKSTGANVIWLKNKDKNMYFGMDFTTLPENDTGVAHILEHSVLHGSLKYPIVANDPFAVMLRRRQLTDINASTWPDKTQYYFSAINSDDFFSTLDFYLDGLFSPLLLQEENIFKQEGWRVGIDENGNFNFNGVVLNEMMSYSTDPIRNLYEGIFKNMLCHIKPYKYNSGGDPNKITDLSFEELKAFYNKYYTPANSISYFYGDVNIERALEMLSRRFETRKGKFYKPGCKLRSEQLSTKGYTQGKPDSDSHMAIGFYGAPVRCIKENIILSILFSSLTDYESDKLKCKLKSLQLSSDIDFLFESDASISQMYILFERMNKKNFKKAKEAVLKVLIEISKEGLDKKRLHNTLNNLMLYYEKDKYLSDVGGRYFNRMSKIWRFADPKQVFEYEEILLEIRDEFQKDAKYFDKYFDKYFIVPDNYGVFRLEAKEDFLYFKVLGNKVKRLNSAGIKTRKRFEDEINNFKIFKSQTDDLSLIKPTPKRAFHKKMNENEVTVSKEKGMVTYFKHLKDAKLTSSEIYFNLSHLTKQELQRAVVLLSLFSKLNAKQITRSDLDMNVSSTFGMFLHEISVLPKKNGKAHVAAKFSFDFLDENIEKAASILNTYIQDLVIDAENLKMQLKEMVSGMKSTLLDWHSCVSIVDNLARSSHGEFYALKNFLFGVDFYRFLQSESKRDVDKLVENYSKLYKKIFCKDGLVVLESSSCKKLNLYQQLNIAQKDYKTKGWVFRNSKKNKLFLINGLAGNINTQAFSLGRIDEPSLLLQWILTYGFLWENIRVKGGAYGARFNPSLTGVMSFVSYNDPEVSETYNIYNRAFGDFTFNKDDFNGAQARSLLLFDKPKSDLTLPFVQFTDDLLGYDKSVIRQRIIDFNEDTLQKNLKKLIESQRNTAVNVTFSSSEKPKKLFDDVEELDL